MAAPSSASLKHGRLRHSLYIFVAIAFAAGCCKLLPHLNHLQSHCEDDQLHVAVAEL